MINLVGPDGIPLCSPGSTMLHQIHRMVGYDGIWWDMQGQLTASRNASQHVPAASGVTVISSISASTCTASCVGACWGTGFERQDGWVQKTQFQSAILFNYVQFKVWINSAMGP